MYIKVETCKNSILSTYINEDNEIVYDEVKNYKPEIFVPNPLGKHFSLIENMPLKRKQFDTIKEYNEFCYQHKDGNTPESLLYNKIKPEYQYIREKFEESNKINNVRIWMFDIETKDKDGEFPDPFKFEVLPEITLIQVSEYDTDKRIIWGWMKDTDVYKEHKNCIYLKFDSEKEMLKHFLETYRKRNVNILTAWNGDLFDFPYLIKRLENLKLNYKLLSPYKTFKIEKVSKSDGLKQNINKPYGVYWLDMLSVYKKFTFGGREKWSLDFIANYEGVDAKLDYTKEGFKNIKDLMNGVFTHEYCEDKESKLYKAYENNDIELIKQLSYDVFVMYGIKDVEIMQHLEYKIKLFNVLISMAQKMRCNLDDSLGTTTPWEIYIYNELYKSNIALPSKQQESESKIFTGGYVYADIGIHKWCMSSDVASLYPSIMRTVNISPETYIKHKDIPEDLYKEINILHTLEHPEDYIIENWNEDKFNKVNELLKKYNLSLSVNGECFNKEKEGIIPKLVRQIYEERVQFKNLKKEAKTEDEKNFYDLKQMTAKIAINSIYGALGSKYFILSNTNIAHAVTSYGRYSIKTTGDYVIDYLNNKYKTDKVYRTLTDTDSYYLGLSYIVDLYQQTYGVKTNEEISDMIDKLDKKIVSVLNRKCANVIYNKFNNFDDVIYYDREKIGHMIITGKKKYAVLLYNNEGYQYEEPKVSVTGLSTVRSDTPAIVRKKLSDILKIMFHNDNELLLEYIDNFKNEYYKDMYSIDDIAIPTGISDIDKFKNKTSSIPIHVRASFTYNNFLKDNKLLENGFTEIQNGDKIKWFRIKKNPFVNSDVFAYTDKSIFKEYDILKYFNYDEMFYRTFKKTVDDLCEVVKLKSNEDSKLMEDLF